MSDIVLSVENLYKQYRLGLVGSGTLKDDLARWWARMRGKEDPLLKIGENNKLDTVEGDYVWALRDINFEVKQGDVLGIVGKNGAGKSTLLKILSKVTGPTKGSIKTKGRVASLLEVGTGFHPELTGRENIFLNGAILGMNKREIRSKLDEIIDFAGVAKYVDTPVKRYSSGMYVRLAFAVAAHLDPEILIVDEVLAVGDAEFQKKAIGKMQDVSKGEGRTVLFVSHNMISVKQLCTNAIMLQNGQKIHEGSADEVVDSYLNMMTTKNNRAIIFDTTNSTVPLRFLEAKVVANNSITNAIDYTDQVNINITYKVERNVSNVVIGCVVKHLSQLVLISFDTDDNPALLESRTPGVYEYVLSLPRNLLGIGIYNINLTAAFLNRETFERHIDCLTFELTNVKHKIMFNSISRKPLVIAPIEWSLVQHLE